MKLLPFISCPESPFILWTPFVNKAGVYTLLPYSYPICYIIGDAVTENQTQ